MSNIRRPKNVTISELLFNPNNPRIKEVDEETHTSKKIVTKKAQEECYNRLQDIMEESPALYLEIQEKGFLEHLDTLECYKLGKKYVLIDGNTRIAVIKSLTEKHNKGEIKLNPVILKSFKRIKIIVVPKSQEDEIYYNKHLASRADWGHFKKIWCIYEKHENDSPSKSNREIAERYNISFHSISNGFEQCRFIKSMQRSPKLRDSIDAVPISYILDIATMPNIVKYIGWTKHLVRIKYPDRLLEILDYCRKDRKNLIKHHKSLRDLNTVIVFPGLFKKFKKGEDIKDLAEIAKIKSSNQKSKNFSLYAREIRRAINTINQTSSYLMNQKGENVEDLLKALGSEIRKKLKEVRNV